MNPSTHKPLLRRLPSISSLLEHPRVQGWLADQPRELVAHCLRATVEDLRRQIVEDSAGRCGPSHVTEDAVLDRAERLLSRRTRPQLRGAINATGIILHTGLGRAVWPEAVVDSMTDELKGYVTLAIDRETGKRSERDQRIEYLLCELTGAEAGVVVNNNAAATLLVLAALCGGHPCIVSRGQLIEIGGSFRLPDVMAQSGSQLVEVGTTNRTHLRDYAAAITEETAAIMRVHPSNYRIVGFTKQPGLDELVELSHRRGLLLIDDLGAGAIVGLEQFGLPHEPTFRESIDAGADVVLASADKLIGAGQGGVIVGRKEVIDRIRTHPLYRAMRVDKTCLMALERTLMLFRDADCLRSEHPTYRMLSAGADELRRRAERLAEAIGRAAPTAEVEVIPSAGYLGSGSLPMQPLAGFAAAVSLPQTSAEHLAKALRLDEACVFSRVEGERVLLDSRTITDEQIATLAEAVGHAGEQ
jgi:L-seryl-tRNA(Ser) seleniumtransferase